MDIRNAGVGLSCLVQWIEIGPGITRTIGGLRFQDVNSSQVTTLAFAASEALRP